MKQFVQILASFCFIYCSSQSLAAACPDLKKEDLKAILTDGKIVKDGYSLVPFDETAAMNIAAALGNMAFKKPFYLDSEGPLCRYQVNPDEHSKIKEIWLKQIEPSTNANEF